MADSSWCPAPVGERSQLGAWDCVARRKSGFKANFAWRDTCRSCGRNRNSVGGRVVARSKKSGEALLISRQLTRREKSSSWKLLPCPNSRVLARGSTRRPWLAKTGGKVKAQKTLVQQASVEGALETSRECRVRGRRGHALVAFGRHPSYLSWFPRRGRGQGGCRGIDFWCSWSCSWLWRPSSCRSTSWGHSAGRRG